MKTTAMVGGGSMLVLGGGCVPNDFWISASGEVVNRSIFGIINAVLTAIGTGITI